MDDLALVLKALYEGVNGWLREGVVIHFSIGESAKQAVIVEYNQTTLFKQPPRQDCIIQGIILLMGAIDVDDVEVVQRQTTQNYL